jgi:hypothetical protein
MSVIASMILFTLFVSVLSGFVFVAVRLLSVRCVSVLRLAFLSRLCAKLAGLCS